MNVPTNTIIAQSNATAPAKIEKVAAVQTTQNNNTADKRPHSVNLCVCWHPLMAACAAGNCDDVRNVLHQGDVRTRGDFDLAERGPNHLRALHFAVRSGARCTHCIVVLLLGRGAHVDAPDRDGFTPLMTSNIWAPTEQVALRVARTLIEHGACADRAMCDGRTAADFADEQGYRQVAAYLRQPDVRAAGPNKRRRVRAVARALAQGRVVLDHGGDRGPHFGALTQWLDYELVDALAGDAQLSFKQIQQVVHMIRNKVFVPSLKELAVTMFGKSYINLFE